MSSSFAARLAVVMTAFTVSADTGVIETGRQPAPVAMAVTALGKRYNMILHFAAGNPVVVAAAAVYIC